MNKLILAACGIALLIFAWCGDDTKGQSNADSPEPQGNDDDSGNLNGGNRHRVSRSVPAPKPDKPAVAPPVVEPKAESESAPKVEPKAD